MNKTSDILDLANEITTAQCELLNAKVILNLWLTEYGGNDVSMKTLHATDENSDHISALLWVVKYEEIEKLISIAQDYVIKTSELLERLGVQAESLCLNEQKKTA